jgi:hypothetical protein
MKILERVSVFSAVRNMWKHDEPPGGSMRSLPAVNVFALAQALAAIPLKLWLGVCSVLLISLVFGPNVYAQSPDGSTITPSGGGSLSTSAGTWSFGSDCGSGNSYILLNSAQTNACGNLLLVYNGGQMYADTSWYVWFLYSAPYFGESSGDPRVIGSASCTQLPDAQAYVDTSGTTWTLSGGDSYENGNADGGSNFTQMVYFQSNTYAVDTNGQWWENSGGWFTIGGDPRGSSCTLSPSGASITPSSGGSLVDINNTVWTLDGSGNSYENGNADGGANITLLLYFMGNIYANTSCCGWFQNSSSNWNGIGGDPRGSAQPAYNIPVPNGYSQWVMTFDDEFSQDSVINPNVWNGGGGDTDFCDFVVVDNEPDSQFFFNDSPSNPCAQVYDNLNFDGSELQMWSASQPWSAIQTSGASENMAKHIQKFGYWEASIKQPETSYGHSDFWMHPEPENAWCPEFDVGERLPGNSPYTQLNFAVEDCGGSYNGGFYGASGSPDLGQAYHTYGLLWANDGSGPYGSIQMYLDGVALFSSPYVLPSADTNLANGIYTFFSLDNGGTSDPNNPYQIQYLRVWQAY